MAPYTGAQRKHPSMLVPSSTPPAPGQALAPPAGGELTSLLQQRRPAPRAKAPRSHPPIVLPPRCGCEVSRSVITPNLRLQPSQHTGPRDACRGMEDLSWTLPGTFLDQGWSFLDQGWSFLDPSPSAGDSSERHGCRKAMRRPAANAPNEAACLIRGGSRSLTMGQGARVPRLTLLSCRPRSRSAARHIRPPLGGLTRDGTRRRDLGPA